MSLISVNELLESTESFLERDIFLQGVLACHEENVLIRHWPSNERTDEPFSQIWLYAGDGAFRFEREVLGRVEGKRVVVHGIVKSNTTSWADDPGSLWRVHMLATELFEHKVWIERQCR